MQVPPLPPRVKKNLNFHSKQKKIPIESRRHICLGIKKTKGVFHAFSFLGAALKSASAGSSSSNRSSSSSNLRPPPTPCQSQPWRRMTRRVRRSITSSSNGCSRSPPRPQSQTRRSYTRTTQRSSGPCSQSVRHAHFFYIFLPQIKRELCLFAGSLPHWLLRRYPTLEGQEDLSMHFFFDLGKSSSRPEEGHYTQVTKC